MPRFQRALLTEVQAHADKNYEAEPGVEIGDEVDDGNDNVGHGGDDAEHDVAVGDTKGIREFITRPERKK